MQNDVSYNVNIYVALSNCLCVQEGDTGLTVASINGDAKVVKVLLRANPNKDLKRKVSINFVCRDQIAAVNITVYNIMLFRLELQRFSVRVKMVTQKLSKCSSMLEPVWTLLTM